MNNIIQIDPGKSLNISALFLNQLMVNWWFGALRFGFLGFPYESDCYLGASRFEGPKPLNAPNHQAKPLVDCIRKMPNRYPLYKSNEKNPGYLGYTGDYTTQLYGDYNKPQ